MDQADHTEDKKGRECDAHENEVDGVAAAEIPYAIFVFLDTDGSPEGALQHF